jgi:hypothetical protein
LLPPCVDELWLELEMPLVLLVPLDDEVPEDVFDEVPEDEVPDDAVDEVAEGAFDVPADVLVLDFVTPFWALA